jgi:dTMP kinase
MKGKFVVVDGLGGAGKSTVLDKIEAFCKDGGLDYVRTREPGGTFAAEYLRKLCREGIPGDPDKLEPITQALLFNAARAENVQKVILPALRAGKVVLCDRFADTTYAFQGGALGVDLGVLQGIHQLAHGINPDMTFLLDGKPEVFLQRISPEEMASDQFDNLELTKLKNARSMYLTMSTTYPEQYRVIDAMQSQEQVFAQILPYLQELKNLMRQRPSTKGVQVIQDAFPGGSVSIKHTSEV